jgi:hypothetical protein
MKYYGNNRQKLKENIGVKHCVENSMVCLNSHRIVCQKQLRGKVNQKELIEFSSIALWILVIMSYENYWS